MKTENNILIAFALNLSFSMFEFVGGLITGSVAIISDAIHDLGDAISIGISYFLEKKSKREPDDKYTYGYGGYSIIGGIITSMILVFGSAAVIFNAIDRFINPVAINYDGMILMAIFGVGVNLAAALVTRKGGSLNQKAVNLHMLEDVLGWIVVLLGAIAMNFTDFALIDPIMSIGVAAFILANALKNLRDGLQPLLMRMPDGIELDHIKKQLTEMDGVIDVHHIHIWSMDGQNNYATMHIVAEGDFHQIKDRVKALLRYHGIAHASLELEKENEHCHDKKCSVAYQSNLPEHHHHHHH